MLPLKSDDDEESMLAKLPDDIFRRVFLSLNTLETFRLTLVCKRWKSLIYNSRGHLKKAEHAVTTHIITFNDWMDPASILTKHLKNHSKFCYRDSTWLDVSASIPLV